MGASPRRGRSEPFPPECPVDRFSLRRRNQACIAVIALGMLNFLAYTVIYAGLGGDAANGARRVVLAGDGTRAVHFTVRGHHIRSLSGQEREVSAAMWIYSYLHSISVPITSGALIISMLILARPHILATMRYGWISGQTFIVGFGTIVLLITASLTVLFVWDFAAQMSQ